MSNIFRFKKFSIKQDPNVFKVGTDGVLLGCLAEISHSKSILDIGTGTGLLALICAQRNLEAEIIAIDSEMESYNLAEKNFKTSPFASRLSIIHSELKLFNLKKTFDYIICNPPYFPNSKQLHQTHPRARHQLKMDYSLLIHKTHELLAENGASGYIFPFEDENKVINTAKNYNLFPKRIIHISGIKNGKIKRTFLELSRKKQNIITDKIHLEESPRIRSEKYIKLTSDFYL